MTTNDELSKTIVSILTTNVPVILTNDLRKGLDHLNIHTGSFNRSLTRLKRMGLVTTFVANLPRLTGWRIRLTQAAMSDAMITKVMTVSRACTNQPGKTYFMLSASSIAKLGLPTFKSEPLAESAKLRTYARLLFYTQYNSTAIKIDGDELARKLAEPSHGMPPGFFGSTSNPGFLGFLRVDAHIHTSPVRSAQVLRHDVLRLIKFASIRERLKSKQFELAWITATQTRADAVMSHFRSYDRIGKAPIKVFVFSELVPLVCPMEFST